MKGLIFLITLISTNIALAGTIRDVAMDASRMEPIYLKMGQSTILRFKDKPKKVVIGNQNYYSVEFIENDVTIQPLGSVKTNLFVYTENRVYGFILTVDYRSNYDDLVNVNWNYRQSYSIQKKEKKTVSIKPKKLNLVFQVNNLKVTVKELWFHQELQRLVIDSDIANHSKNEIDTKSLSLFFSRNEKRLANQEHAFEKQKIAPGQTVKVRSLLQIDEHQGFSFYLDHEKRKGRVIISKGHL